MSTVRAPGPHEVTRYLYLVLYSTARRHRPIHQANALPAGRPLMPACFEGAPRTSARYVRLLLGAE